MNPILDEPLRSDCVRVPSPLAVGAAAPTFSGPSEPVLRNGLISVFDQGIVSGTNFLTVVVLARACTQAEVGLYALAWTIVVFLTAAQTNLISIPYTMYCHRRQGSTAAEYAGSAIVHQLLFSAVSAACIVALAGLFSLGIGPNGMGPMAWVLAAAVPFILMRDFARRISFAHLALKTAFVLDAFVSAAMAGSLLLLWGSGLLSIAAVYGAMGGACAAAAIGWLFLRKQPLGFSRESVVRDWRRNWLFGRWALTGQMTGLAFYALPWMLAAVRGEAETGKLAACTTLVGLSNLFVMALNNVLMPKAAQTYASNGVPALARVLRKTALAATVVLGGMCLGVFFCGDLVAHVFFGPTYIGTGTLLTVLAIAALTDSLGQTAAAGLWALDRPAANFAADAAYVSVMIVAAIGLVFSLGALGVALAIVAGRVAGAAARWIMLWGFMERGAARTAVNSCQAIQ
ncbi:MAG: lipopolysaccharide biosynthesis protein [Pirellulales bacterium]|nr:lipopolysaccharide biosynthesis protein [Pirellulales bacterium]